MCDKAYAAMQQELQFISLEGASKGSLEGRKFSKGRLENMSGTERVRLGRSPHTLFHERPEERLFTGRSCHYLQDPKETVHWHVDNIHRGIQWLCQIFSTENQAVM